MYMYIYMYMYSRIINKTFASLNFCYCMHVEVFNYMYYKFVH